MPTSAQIGVTKRTTRFYWERVKGKVVGKIYPIFKRGGNGIGHERVETSTFSPKWLGNKQEYVSFDKKELGVYNLKYV